MSKIISFRAVMPARVETKTGTEIVFIDYPNRAVFSIHGDNITEEYQEEIFGVLNKKQTSMVVPHLDKQFADTADEALAQQERMKKYSQNSAEKTRKKAEQESPCPKLVE